jgi:DNA-nicking Smr family endonuclease
MTSDTQDPEPAVELPLDGILDLHTFHPREVRDLVPTWLDASREKGLWELRIIHGKGTGVLQRTVHAILARTPYVLAFGLSQPDAGGWGSTWVTLRR